ncbi:response regulator transcription factor [Flavihumibacter sp. UBA7668]|uniref:response regulator transcription factor n=1 Tax=Flavihumibacter sp. UBA7668 TaxID=1946542 RepID=UPI0025BA0173|nr:response regulator transcription factor [Flavihumibacter sp. UBA7668]
MQVLIVEDERLLSAEMAAFLKKSFYTCTPVYSAKEALQQLVDNEFDFVLLDLGLPDKDGLTVLHESKKHHPETAYIILTARGEVEDRIKGLDLGADDYLPKPFSLLELLSRMQAITRRKSGLADSQIELGAFLIDLKNRSILAGNVSVELSKKEFDLLSYLILHKNRPLTRTQLSERIWGAISDDDYDSNYIDVHIKNIRKKLGLWAETDWLETVRGVGYKIRLQS